MSPSERERVSKLRESTRRSKKSSSLRYGVILLPYSVSFDKILQAALRAEDLGFDSVWISDHLQRSGKSVLECWTLISALAAKTTKIRVGSLATCNSFRNPSLLARMISTISQISGGRADAAIGLGYDPLEHTANGFEFPDFSKRVEMLSESLHILNMLWSSKKPVDFEGSQYRLRGALSNPKPVGKPRIWVAGRNRRVIEIATRLAYGINILPYSGTLEKRRISSPEELKEIVREIDSIAKSRSNFGKSMYCGDGGVVIGSTESDYRVRVNRSAKSEGLSKLDYEARLNNLSIIHGTADQCRDSVKEISSLGFEELMMVFPGWQSGNYENMNLFAREFLK